MKSTKADKKALKDSLRLERNSSIHNTFEDDFQSVDVKKQKIEKLKKIFIETKKDKENTKKISQGW